MRSRVLIDKETHLIGELLIVESGGEHGLLYEVKLDLIGPLVGLEVAGNLLGTDFSLEETLGVGADTGGLHQDLGDTLVEFAVLDLVKGNVDFSLNGSLEIQVLSISDHFQGQLHGELRVLAHLVQANLSEAGSL